MYFGTRYYGLVEFPMAFFRCHLQFFCRGFANVMGDISLHLFSVKYEAACLFRCGFTFWICAREGGNRFLVQNSGDVSVSIFPHVRDHGLRMVGSNDISIFNEEIQIKNTGWAANQNGTEEI